MCCFLVPLAQAAATSVCRRSFEKSGRGLDGSPCRRHPPALEEMLWGGSVMLSVHHIINGELTWRFPFFTALDQVGGGAVMLRELLTVGLPMSVVLTAVWVVYALVKDRSHKTAAL